MDEFAQSREDNDLFADDFEPASQPIVIEEAGRDGRQEEIGGHGREADDAAAARSGAGTENSRGGGQGGRRERRGGGQGRGDQEGQKGLSASMFAPQSEQVQPEIGESKGANGGEAPTDPTYRGTQAVRGDRSATGGPAHKKLTEEELSEKMAKMKVINAQKTERFRLSEADSAAFAQKEKELEKKRVEEKKNSRAMDMERAKNRERKMKAQGGREWDSEKVESDLVDGKGRGRSSEYFRGAHGAVGRGRANGLAGSMFSAENVVEGEGNQSPAYRGGFQRGRGKGRGGTQRGQGGRSQALPGPEDFPSLPPSMTKVAESKPKNATPISTKSGENGFEKVDEARGRNGDASNTRNGSEATKTNKVKERSSSRPPVTRGESNWAEEMAAGEGDKASEVW